MHASLRILTVLSAVAIMLSASGPVPAAHAGEGPGGPGDDADDAVFFFDLPALPLDQALRRYAETTGHPAIFPSDLLVGRTSSPVRGRYSTEAALRSLLRGTRLVASRRGNGRGRTFVLEEAGRAPVPRGEAPAPLFRDEGYAGLAQAGIWRSLCADPRTRPGSYTALVRFRIGRDGRLQEVGLLEGSGSELRDAALLERLGAVRIPGYVPGDLAQQPLVMAVLPSDPGGPQCQNGGER